MAELIAEYSPPIPAPVKNRKTAKLQKSHEKRGAERRDQVEPQGHREQLLAADLVGQIAEDQGPQHRADQVGRTQQADLPLGEVERVLVRTPPIAPTSVTSRPSMIQVIPRAITTFQCHRPQGSRSIRAGMSVLIEADLPLAWFIESARKGSG